MQKRMQRSDLWEGAGTWASVKNLMMRSVQVRSLTLCLGVVFASWWDRHRSGFVAVRGVGDAWGDVSLLIGGVAVCWWSWLWVEVVGIGKRGKAAVCGLAWPVPVVV